jgi:hypothetical protein
VVPRGRGRATESLYLHPILREKEDDSEKFGKVRNQEKGDWIIMRGKGRERGCSYWFSNHLFCFLFSKCMGRVGIHSILYIPKHNVFLSSSIIYATCVYNLRDFVVIYFNTFTIINICSEISIYINKLEDKEYEHLFVFIWVQL